MSLGLEDLSKKRRPVAKKGSAEQQRSDKKIPHGKQKYPAGAWARSTTARPWDSTGLNRGSKARRRPLAADAAMNEEWNSQHAESLFWVDLKRYSRLLCFHDRFAALEEKIHDAIVGPWQRIRGFFKQK